MRRGERQGAAGGVDQHRQRGPALVLVTAPGQLVRPPRPGGGAGSGRRCRTGSRRRRRRPRRSRPAGAASAPARGRATTPRACPGVRASQWARFSRSSAQTSCRPTTSGRSRASTARMASRRARQSPKRHQTFQVMIRSGASGCGGRGAHLVGQSPKAAGPPPQGVAATAAAAVARRGGAAVLGELGDPGEGGDRRAPAPRRPGAHDHRAARPGPRGRRRRRRRRRRPGSAPPPPSRPAPSRPGRWGPPRRSRPGPARGPPRARPAGRSGRRAPRGGPRGPPRPRRGGAPPAGPRRGRSRRPRRAPRPAPPAAPPCPWRTHRRGRHR